MLESPLIQHFPDLRPANVRHLPGFWTDEEFTTAGCMHTAEALLLSAYVETMAPRNILEIGAYVGWSTAHLALNARNPIDVVDPFTTGCRYFNTDVLRRFWQNIIRCELEDKVNLYPLRSPDCLERIAPKEGWDFVLIDGHHHDKQPMRDVKGVLPHLAEDGVIVLHDTFFPNVATAANYLVEQGFYCVDLQTPAEMQFFWYHSRPASWHRIETIWEAMFADA